MHDQTKRMMKLTTHTHTPSRLLDMLLDINNSSAIPLEKRIDVSRRPPLDILSADREPPPTPGDDTPLKRLEDLLAEVPHLSYDQAKDAHPELIRDLEAPESGSGGYPAHFLTADDIDDYLHAIDRRIAPTAHIPTLAPTAHPSSNPVHPLLKNPNSSISWLQRNKPSIFTHEPESATTGAGAGHQHHDDNAGGVTGTDKEGGAAAPSSSRKSRGGKTAADRPAKSSRPSKRTSAIKAAAAADKGRKGDWDVSMDEDPDFASTPVPKGKRKRASTAVDSDAGYKPKGSGSRPTKKKRRSEGAAEGTPTASRKSKKEAAAAAAAGDD